ncbi:MAG: CAP domain-containing protein [Myxococcales bacterium]|nr:CAP domain-containing protein [Myxococcales bacterium]
MRKTAMNRLSLAAALGLSLGSASCAGPSSTGERRPRTQTAEVLPDGATDVELGDMAGIRSRFVEARLSTAPAKQYSVSHEHDLRPGEERLAAAFTKRGLRHEPGLSRMARELARTAPDRYHMPSSLIEGLMIWGGQVEPPPRIAIVEIAADCGEHPDADGCAEAYQALAGEIETLRPEADVDGWFGVGIHRLDSGLSRFIVAGTERTVSLDPLPLEVASGATIKIGGRLLSKRENPRVEVIDPKGEWRPTAIRGGKTRGARFTAEVPCGPDGGHRIEVLADGPHGPEIAANFSVFCGAQAPRTITFMVEDVEPGVDTAVIERANFDAVNQARTRRGLQPLRWSNAAAEVARAHSQDMAHNGFLGHRSPTTGMAGDRFEAAGIKALRLRENVGRGYGPVTIHEALMNSPGHRINVLADDVTEVGIGAVIGAPESEVAGAPRPIFLTQNFIAPPEAAPDDPVAEVRRRVDERRQAAKVGRIAWDATLQGIAQRYAEGVANGTEDAARDQLNADFQASAYAAIETQKVTANDFSAFATLDLWDAPKMADGVGVGIAAITKGPKQGSLVMIVLLADRTAPAKKGR